MRDQGGIFGPWLPRLQVVTEQHIAFTQVKFSIRDCRMRPAWPLARAWRFEFAQLVVAVGRSFREGHCAVGIVKIDAAVSSRNRHRSASRSALLPLNFSGHQLATPRNTRIF